MPFWPISASSHDLSQPEALPHRTGKTGSLQGKTVAVVFNENARDGEVAQDFQKLEKLLQGEGARVVGIKTVRDLRERRALIMGTMMDLLKEIPSRPPVPHHIYQELPPFLVMPYGGDFTFCETVRQTVMAAGISLHPEQNGRDIADRLKSQVGFFLMDKGKAGDNAKQVLAPDKISKIPKFAKGAVDLPFWFTVIETPTANGGHFEVAGHSYSAGVSGYLFGLREQNLAENPKSYWNKGLKSYFRLLPHAAMNRYGWLGFDVGIKHFYTDGSLKQSTVNRASELMITPNRLIAKVGGVPGAWGETKVILLPPGGGGVMGLLEYVFRGVATKNGWNQVSPHHSMKTISADREISLAPGEWLEVETRVPDTLSWKILRWGQELNGRAATELGWIYRTLGIGKPGPVIPPAGSLMEIPTILNGDVVTPHARFKVHVPDYSLEQLAHPGSLGVSLARDSALLEGKSPLISDQKLVAHIIPEEGPLSEISDRSQRVRTPFLSLRRLDQLLGHRDFKINPERISELLSNVQGVEIPTDLRKLADRELTVEKIHTYLRSQQDLAVKHFGGRLWQQGVPLAAGLGALWGGEILADKFGLDREADREIRFAMMMYLGHAAQANFQPLWEVAINRSLNRPYDFARIRQVRVASEALAQWTYFRHASLGEAIGASWRTGALALETGVRQSLWSMGGRAAMIPARAAWNMGHGLIFSRVTEGLVQAFDAPQPIKDYGPAAAFFLPDAGRILVPRATIGMMSHRGINFGARVFAAGFMADMAFAGWQHAKHGSGATRERRINAVAAELRRRDIGSGLFAWREGLRFLSPTLADHIDSHEYGFGSANVYHRIAEKY